MSVAGPHTIPESLTDVVHAGTRRHGVRNLWLVEYRTDTDGV